MRRVFALAVFVAAFCTSSLTAFAQVNVRFEARADIKEHFLAGDYVQEDSGFSGHLLNIKIDGDLSENFDYHFRQRLNRLPSTSFFEAVDYVYLRWKFCDAWSLSAGKLIWALGGIEYDKAPIDMYQYSEYCNHTPCYAWGASLQRQVGAYDLITLQVTQGPFSQSPKEHSLNLAWHGTRRHLRSICSTNFLFLEGGKCLNYTALGAEFLFGNFALQADLLHRQGLSAGKLFGDYSIMSELDYRPVKLLNIFGRYTFDVNNNSEADNIDPCVAPGTEMQSLCAGVEVFPLKDDRVRFHLVARRSFGANGFALGGLRTDETMIQAGLTWRVGRAYNL